MKELILFLMIAGFAWVTYNFYLSRKKDLYVYSVRQKWKDTMEKSINDKITLHIFATNVCNGISITNVEVPEKDFMDLSSEEQKIIVTDYCKQESMWLVPVKYYLGVKGSYDRCDVKTLVYM